MRQILAKFLPDRRPGCKAMEGMDSARAVERR